MANITLTISDELREAIKKHKEVNWSAVIRKAMEEHLKRAEIAERIASKSKLTKKDAQEIADLVNKATAKDLGLYPK